ncbi:alpha/beta fold hydrolase [Actinomadura vinacea]|uniref:Alpha/beta fold hydrolase n=1 Tax=Actinomadura vinacea TaxID=115336 RepID=A0ABN3JA18_9ACTN
MARTAIAFLTLSACGLAGAAAACTGGRAGSSGAAQGSGGPGGPPSSITTQRPVWKPCRDLPLPRTDTATPAFECATVKVPLDYAAPRGRTIRIALLRIKATKPDRRIGSLLFNFGGPGASGVETLAQAAGEYRTLNTRYDLVGFDPRGVGRSAPVTCVDDRRMDQLTAMDDSPDDPAEERALTDARASYDQGCEARSGSILPYVGTRSAARDMDMVRAALGDARLHYFGISYGTWLGGSYANQIPRNVGRAVLDGAVDTKISDVQLGLQQAAAFQRALGAFGAACAGHGPTACPLGRDSRAVVATVAGLLNGLDARPLPTKDPARPLTQSLGTTGVAAALYSEQLWPILARALTEAVRGRDGTTLLTLADLQLGRQEDGRYTNLVAAGNAITCADTTERHTVEEVRRLLPRFRGASPIFGPDMAWSLLGCTGWPVRGDAAAGEVGAPAARPIVVIGNTGDPATPYAWAPALTKAIGGQATLLTLKGQGHGAYDTGDRCVRKAVDRYLLDGTVPPNGTVCD